jgi:hypothetical protein
VRKIGQLFALALAALALPNLAAAAEKAVKVACACCGLPCCG